MDTAPLRSLLEQVVAVQLAAAGPGLVPASVRGFGVRFDAEARSLSFVVLDLQSHAFQQAATLSPTLAVNLTNPVTFRAVQAKGPLLSVEPPSDEARTFAEEYWDGFLVAVKKVGFKTEQLRGLFCRRGGARWVSMRAEQLFNQTPGPGAGGVCG